MATHIFFGLKHFGVGADEEKKKCCMQPTEVLTFARKIPQSYPRGIGIGGERSRADKMSQG